MLRTTCALLGNYLNKPAEQISIDRINESREDFRAFLQRSKYKEASIRSYLNFARILLKSAKSLGWKPTDSIPEAWRGVLALAAEKKCTDDFLLKGCQLKMAYETDIFFLVGVS
jgi:hypothetical protein